MQRVKRAERLKRQRGFVYVKLTGSLREAAEWLAKFGTVRREVTNG